MPSFELTPDQQAANKLLASDAGHVMLYGGSRSGKTFLICRAIAIRALKAEGSRHAILRYRFNAVKTAIWHDTWPKMMALCFPEVSYGSNKADWFFEMPNGSQVWIGGLDDKERTEKILGQEYATVFLNECSQISFASRELVTTRVAQKVGLKPRMYYDENPPRVTHWTYRLFINKVRPEPPYNRLDDQTNYAAMRLNPAGNAVNLPHEYIDSLQQLGARAKLRFWSGEFGDAGEGQLWSHETIERFRVSKAPQLVRIVIPIDPSGTKGEEDDRSDQVGIGAVGVGIDGHGYVLEDLTCKAPPAVWGKIAVTAYQRHAANVVVGETNFGGAMVEHVVKTAAAKLGVYVPYVEVTATRGKVVRAEPFSSLYEQGKVHHVGQFPELEDQLCDMTTAGYMGDRSPDRADWLVWGLTELFPGLTRREKRKDDGTPHAETRRQRELVAVQANPLDGF